MHRNQRRYPVWVKGRALATVVRRRSRALAGALVGDGDALQSAALPLVGQGPCPCGDAPQSAAPSPGVEGRALVRDSSLRSE